VLDREADVVGRELELARLRLVEERGRAHGRRAAAGDVAVDLAHRQAAVDDVLDDQHRLAVHVELRLLEDRHHSRRRLLVSGRSAPTLSEVFWSRYDETWMKSRAASRSMCRTKSLQKNIAPLSTQQAM